ncbi:MAG: hypothetical protein ACREXR_01695 [Gammaproteobacteria bacterium]
MIKLHTQDDTQAKKRSATTRKSRVQWKPAKLLDTVTGFDHENFVPRWVDKDPANLVRKQAEGWEFVSPLKGDKAVHERPGNLQDGTPMASSLTEYRDLVLMKIPKEMVEARNEYYSMRTQEQLDGLVTKPKSMARELGGDVEASFLDESDVDISG